MRYALIGCGRISPNHIMAAKNNGLEMVAICDIDVSCMEDKVKKFDLPETVKLYTDYKELLETEKLELVAVTTESGLHASIAIDCINAGCNVIIEKPIASMDQHKCVRDDKTNAYVNIIYGCNKFCTYCIVPYVRGREMSRNPQEIYEEVKDLVQNQGYKYITLLGQNVNSYGKDLENKMTFSELLKYLCTIEGDFKIKFMTSHPMDFGDDLIKVMKTEKKVAKYLHLPVQSGSSKILHRMNRHYDIKHYKSLIRKVKRAIPNIALSTDLIVGFPGETEKDFNLTMKLIKKVKYDLLFAFMYSKRSGTPAAEFEDQVDEEVKNVRVNKILRTQKIIQKELLKNCFKKTYNCLIKHVNGVAVGLTDGGREIYIPNYKYSNQNYFANVKVEEIRNHKLSGVIDEE